MKSLRVTVLLTILVWVSACGGCSPAEPGESCDPDRDEPCVEGFACLEAIDGEFFCSIPAGGACDPTAEADYCQSGASCTSTSEDDPTQGLCLLERGGNCDIDSDDPQCAEGLSCEQVQGGEPACFESVVLSGLVLDATDRAAIEGAQVIGIDELATSVTDVAETDANGRYELSVPAIRDAEGTPIEQFYTLRVSAQDYQTFPGGLRTALPIDLSEGAMSDDEKVYRIENALTEVVLIPLPEAERGRPVIRGEVVSSKREDGVLVVAQSGGKGYSALTDRAGQFTLFNVPAGSYEIKGFIADVQFEPQNLDVAGEDVEGVEIVEADGAPATLTGDVNIVNAPGGSVTSVVLVVASTFDDTFVRGEVPIGLRAPKQGAPNVSGSWRIEGVPAGEYVVLAAFENDDLVRDPDTNIAGTDIVRVTVTAGQGEVALGESFKVTEALDVQAPGANDAEAVTSKPTLRWRDDSGEEYYEIDVYNAYGELVWEKTVPKSQSDLSVPYEGPLDEGMYYQFRVKSWRQPGGKDPSAISTTEDLRGVFFKPVAP